MRVFRAPLVDEWECWKVVDVAAGTTHAYWS